MDEDTINLLKTIQSDIDILVEGTHPNIQRIPNMTAHCILKKIQVDLKKLDTNLFMKSKHLEGLL
jgi:predicted nucleotidyltransferase